MDDFKPLSEEERQAIVLEVASISPTVESNKPQQEIRATILRLIKIIGRLLGAIDTMKGV